MTLPNFMRRFLVHKGQRPKPRDRETLPNFISFRGHGETCVPLPIQILGAKLYCFALRVDKSKTQQYVDSVLNAVAPAGTFQFKILGNHVLLVFVHADRGRSSAVGWEEDRETSFFVPVFQDVPVADHSRFLLWPCYTMIESSLGLTTGREILGYNKSQGFTSLPLRESDPLVFSTETVTFDTLSGNTEGKRTQLVSARHEQRGSAVGRLVQDWVERGNAFREISQALHTFEDFAAAEINALSAGINVPVINLKQLRDAEQNKLACYQALVIHNNRIMWKGGGRLPPGDYIVEIKPCASHLIADDLGLTNPIATNSYRAEFPFWIALDFTIEPGSNLWCVP